MHSPALARCIRRARWWSSVPPVAASVPGYVRARIGRLTTCTASSRLCLLSMAKEPDWYHLYGQWVTPYDKRDKLADNIDKEMPLPAFALPPRASPARHSRPTGVSLTGGLCAWCGEAQDEGECGYHLLKCPHMPLSHGLVLPNRALLLVLPDRGFPSHGRSGHNGKSPYYADSSTIRGRGYNKRCMRSWLRLRRPRRANHAQASRTTPLTLCSSITPEVTIRVYTNTGAR